MQYLELIKRNWRVYLESYKDDVKQRKNKDYFRPSGTQVYCGKQGSGKTISAVKHVLDCKTIYKKAIIVSNLNLFYFNKRTFNNEQELQYVLNSYNQETDYIFFQTLDELAIALVKVNNATNGVIYLIDEIHTYFNALDSKNIPMYVFTEISQQRKQRKIIIGTSQLFLRMAKPFREQCDNLIICSTKFGIFTTQKAYDGMDIDTDYNGKLVGSLRKSGFFFHNRYLRNAFDTFQKVVSGSEQYEQTNRPIVIKKNKIIMG